MLYLLTKESTLLYLYTRIAQRKIIIGHLHVCTTQYQAQSYETTRKSLRAEKKALKSPRISRITINRDKFARRASL